MLITNSVCKEVWFTMNRPLKMLLFNFGLFPFLKFQMILVKNPIKISRVLMKFYYVTNIFDNETVALLKFFKICTEMHFVSLFFLNERNITASSPFL